MRCQPRRWIVLIGLIGLLPTASMAQVPDARVLRELVGAPRGLCALVGVSHDEALATIRQAAGDELTWYIQLARGEDVAAVRQVADRAGLLGTRVYVERATGRQVYLADNLADVLVASAGASRISKSELRRALRPRGRLVIGSKTTVKPVPKGSGEWTHPYHAADNNPQSEDQLAKAPYLTRFLAAPYYGPMPEVTVSAGGRLFKAFGFLAFKRREWPMVGKLVAMNAYNGSQLWERKLEPGFMIHRSTIVATPDVLYLADNNSCKLIDAATGKIRDEIVFKDDPAWKWMTLRDGVLYALVGESEKLHPVHLGTRTKTGWPWTSVRGTYGEYLQTWGFGRTLIAWDVNEKKVLWSRSEPEPIDSRGVCMNSEQIFLYSHQQYLLAVDAQTGRTQWETADADLMAAIGSHHRAQTASLGYATSAYAKCSDRAIYFAGPTRTKLVAVSASDGKLLWTYRDGNMQLILRDDGLYAMGRLSTSKKFDPISGKELADLKCFRGNCTRATGTVDSIFARGHRHTGTLRFDVAYQQPRRLPGMRPACQDGVIVANGQLYWGPWMCDCNHSLVGVISLASAGDFEFDAKASEKDRLVTGTRASVAPLETSASDWPTYRGNNRRTAATPVAVPDKVSPVWQTKPTPGVEPTAPTTAGGLAFIAGSNGTVRAFDAATGREAWRAYTGGAVTYPPTIDDGRVYVGSGDGWVYCFEATTGRQLWKFRAAPVERKIPVYGRLLSTWPVASGVMVEDGVAYAGAGIICHDGTHVYALDARTGSIRWQNNTSDNLLGEDETVGVSVQGHLLMHDNKLHMAGGNVVSPAIYDIKTGECLNKLEQKPDKSLDDHWKMQRSSRGSELFVVQGKVAVAGEMLYRAPIDGPPSRYFAKFLLQASAGDVIIQGTDKLMLRVDPKPDDKGKPRIIWQDKSFARTEAVVLARNAVIVAGELPGMKPDAPLRPALAARDAETGKLLWAMELPARPRRWGVAVDRDGRVLVTLVDGRVVCFGG